jgi:2-amino-4-hydroxy-6-hydroxymethyldihydropteridine diphosphokinase
VSVRAAIGLGSNLGDREANIRAAIVGLDQLGTLFAASSLYQTAPVGGPPQDDYLNAVVLLDTTLEPQALLEGAMEIERSLGRERESRWGPRTIDIDILLFGDRTVHETGLTIPHPELTRRRFVLEPLLEVWPDAHLPDGAALAPRLTSVSGQEVRRVGSPWGSRAVLMMFGLVAVAAVLLWWLVGALL